LVYFKTDNAGQDWEARTALRRRPRAQRKSHNLPKTHGAHRRPAHYNKLNTSTCETDPRRPVSVGPVSSALQRERNLDMTRGNGRIMPPTDNKTSAKCAIPAGSIARWATFVICAADKAYAAQPAHSVSTINAGKAGLFHHFW